MNETHSHTTLRSVIADETAGRSADGQQADNDTWRRLQTGIARLNQILATDDLTSEKTLTDVARGLTACLPQSRLTGARIVLDEIVAETAGFEDANQILSEDLVAAGKNRGRIVVAGKDLPDGADSQGPLQLHERLLIRGLAATMGLQLQQREVAEALRQSKGRIQDLQNIIEASPVTVFRWVLTDGWPVAYVSENVDRFGYTAGEFCDGTAKYEQLVHPDDLERVSNEVRRYISEKRREFRQTYRLVCRTGEIRWVDDRTTLISSPSGEITHAQGIIVDITERVELEERASRYLQTAGNMFVALDGEGIVTGVNAKTSEITGFSEAELVGIDWIDEIVASEDREASRRYFELLRSGQLDGGRGELDNIVVSKDGRRHTIHWYVNTDTDSSGVLTDIFGFGADVTEQREAESMLGDFARFPRENPSPVLRLDRHGDVLLANPPGQALIQELAAQSDWLHAQNEETWANITRLARTATERSSLELQVSEKTYLFEVMPILDREYVNFYGKDITSLRAAEAKIERMAFHDALTGLANRRLLMERLSQANAKLRRSGEKYAVLLMDLDHFKNVNDLLGHSAGDKLLMEVSARLRSVVRELDTVARMGGDEFVIVQTGMSDRSQAVAVAEKIINAMRQPFRIDDEEITVGASVGIAIAEQPEIDFEILLDQADIALNEVKRRGRGAYEVHSPELGEASQTKITISSRLDQAVHNHEFFLAYQPQIRIADQKLVGCEALIRWRDPQTGELVPPGIFIPVAEAYGKIREIGDWVFGEAARQCAEWRTGDASIPRVSVNVATVQLQDSKFVDRCLETVMELNLPTTSLELEITESSYLGTDPGIHRSIERLHEAGFSFAIDDFGTGYSSLAYLQRLPITRLKIAQELVRDMAQSESDRTIVSATIAMAKKLHLETVAEGVETLNLFQLLDDYGCDIAQGYYFAKPIGADEMRQFVAGHV